MLKNIETNSQTASDHQSDPKPVIVIEGIADWCGAMTGQKPLRDGIRSIGLALGVEMIGVSRLARGTLQRGRLIHCDLSPARARTAPPAKSFARAVLGDYAEKSKPGSLWFSSMLDHQLPPDLAEFQLKRSFNELVVVPLATTPKEIDFLEIHLSDRLDMGKLGVLDQMTDTLVRTWSARTTGLFSEAQLSAKRSRVTPGAPGSLLDVQNPARLSKAEYRVCLMISHGLNTDAICKELNISMSTLRTHLRNVYAKTETHTLAELTYVLLSDTGGRVSAIRPSAAQDIA